MKHTIKEVGVMIANAKRDLDLMKRLSAVLNHVPVKFTEQDFKFLQGWCPQQDSAYKDGSYITAWRLNVENQITKCEESIEVNQRWIEYKKLNPHRCALPKKKQRELGLLPKL